ncbi:MAG: molybdopterin molybdotransferase MoeA [Betaproteobacteria bacterium AqS2]|uniref:Molybdopterin molybdenumtransferase n=1 Tax=Candidatus Amphirhobacter heronislandensis TaxID=1732024 RepID=A0A930UGJ2_9GAMM|nr:molybdopterin molybdotransferase MoeA [Betaproteobacteria bacterium AqS2]
MAPPRAPRMLSEAAMLRAVVQAVAPVAASELLPLGPALRGRVCARDLASPLDLPGGATATMDGYAVRRRDLPGPLPVIGAAVAGAPWTGAVPPGTCVKIATGAWVPAGLDAVLPWETVTADAERITAAAAPRAANIRPAGADVRRGTPAAKRGQRLGARDLALLHGLGVDRVEVWRRPTVGVMSTGDELRDGGARLDPGCCHDANRGMLLALLAQHGFEARDCGLIHDERAALEERMREAAAACDLLLTSGGASVGERDLVKAVLAERGRLTSWRVAIKPGKPFVLGELDATPVLGLPGNPASAFVTYMLLALPALLHLAGCDPLPQPPVVRARLRGGWRKSTPRTEYLRARLSQGRSGPQVKLCAQQDSASLAALAEANCLVRMPLRATKLAAGDEVDALVLDDLL